MPVGIEEIAFYTPKFSLDMVDLANARGEEPDKYTIGIGQTTQSVVPNYEDVVTMGVNAAKNFIEQIDRKSIEMLLFATESGVDNSKSGAIFAKNFLGLKDGIRAIELKQACYAGTLALMQAKDFVRIHPDKKVLVIASDVARYGLNTPGEVTQGAGAVAMLISADPKVAVINDDTVYMVKDEPDFWRPLDSDIALVDGHQSTDVYKEMFLALWGRYKQENTLSLDDIAAWGFHMPYTKMAKKALDQILPEVSNDQQEALREHLAEAQFYNRHVGNLYTGSLYLSLLSLLDRSDSLSAGDRIGLFSFGSGAEAELFSLTLSAGFQEQVAKNRIQSMLDQRQKLSMAEYEAVFLSQHFDSKNEEKTDAPEHTRLCQFIGWQDRYRKYRIAK
ncbi:hydroxymethylglutaryl-CoA synthase [Fructobacillus sp. M1-13]|uniref:Hydroxymethylglutaryl-CoA synthase n=1 Tax=Fructobacillus papyriferae TaxID=2713171 RepID=A0ABS5QPL3_9LACO|nr:hydroxymethylglutaryl-CoA synthase [Fructobacillus papyriferae]MBS9334742.1 hydroxymethylglutaryl-CoA synthase [Fructobacillus papyriferae]MCD2158732.1 hydroxymethylglutaryl-CoA synthase [Fructobacillus papyriferae]